MSPISRSRGMRFPTEDPSSFSARELVNLNLYLRFEEDPVGALAEMHKGLAATGDEDLSSRWPSFRFSTPTTVATGPTIWPLQSTPIPF